MRKLQALSRLGLAWRALLFAAVLGIFGVLAAVAAVSGVIYFGAYNVAATSQHNPIMAWLLHTTALYSIDRRAAGIEPPDLSDPVMIGRGMQLFRLHCKQCHGAPGEPPADFAKGLLPVPPRLMQVGRDWKSQNIYWTIQHGIKMTAMPAWEFRLSNEDIWDLVAFIKQKLPKLSPDGYKSEVAKAGPPPKAVAQLNDQPSSKLADNRSRGKNALAQYACDSCHDIPGLPGAPARIGPPLAGIGHRVVIAGVLANTPANMAEWIRHPQKIKPGDAMPNVGVSAVDASDMVAYLESLH